METVVLVDSNERVLRRAARLLKSAGHQVSCAATGRRGLDMVERGTDVLVVSFRAQKPSGIEVVREARRGRPHTRIVVTDVSLCEEVVSAMRCGANDCTDQSTDSPDTLSKVGVNPTPQDPDSAPALTVLSHSVTRWAQVVAMMTTSPSDLTTLPDWGKFVGVSVGALRSRCYTARLSPKTSLQFARLLRAVLAQRRTGLAAHDLLNIVDSRTLVKLIARGGGQGVSLPTSFDEFVSRQRLIDRPAAIDALRAAGVRDD
jgi:CheY-like chemotaxis protein